MPMPKQLPSAFNDAGFVNEATDYANRILSAETRASAGTLRALNNLPEYLRKVLTEAYLTGANAAIRIGYKLCEKDYEEVINYYKKHIEELGGKVL